MSQPIKIPLHLTYIVNPYIPLDLLMNRKFITIGTLFVELSQLRCLNQSFHSLIYHEYGAKIRPIASPDDDTACQYRTCKENFMISLTFGIA